MPWEWWWGWQSYQHSVLGSCDEEKRQLEKKEKERQRWLQHQQKQAENGPCELATSSSESALQLKKNAETQNQKVGKSGKPQRRSAVMDISAVPAFHDAAPPSEPESSALSQPPDRATKPRPPVPQFSAAPQPAASR